MTTQPEYNTEFNEDFAILETSRALASIRVNNFKNAAKALAELVDNSLQAGEEQNVTNVEVLIETAKNSVRNVHHNHKIAIFDDACGMDSETLRRALKFGDGTRSDDKEEQEGLGKFGMGLPNASLSRCMRVDVYSWQEGVVFHTYLDFEEICAKNYHVVPKPKKTKIPPVWENRIKTKIRKSGTLVIWSKLDRVKWKRPQTLIAKIEPRIGRMYRNFLASGKATIRFAYFKDKSKHPAELPKGVLEYCRPNDPMFLMKSTTAPKPYDKTPAFQSLPDWNKTVKIGGKESKVVIKTSYSTQKARDDGGASGIGKLAANNLGVSIVRAGREMILKKSWNNPSDPRHRWIGVTVEFSPGLDDLFGVTHDKQDALKLIKEDLDELAKQDGFSGSNDMIANLKDLHDPDWFLHTVTKQIEHAVSIAEKFVKNQKEGTKGKTGEGGPTKTGSKVADGRKEEGHVSGTDDELDKPKPEKTKLIKETLESLGFSDSEITDIGPITDRFKFVNRSLNHSKIFEVVPAADKMLVVLNSNHAAYDDLFAVLEKESEGKHPSASLQALQLLLIGWARMEDETRDFNQKQQFDSIAREWGALCQIMLNEHK